MYVVALQSGPRGELQKVNQMRQEKIKEKKVLRDQLGAMKRVDMVSRRCTWWARGCVTSRDSAARFGRSYLASGAARGAGIVRPLSSRLAKRRLMLPPGSTGCSPGGSLSGLSFRASSRLTLVCCAVR